MRSGESTGEEGKSGMSNRTESKRWSSGVEHINRINLIHGDTDNAKLCLAGAMCVVV